MTVDIDTSRPRRQRAGRPTAQRAEEIDRKIIETARAHFLDLGFEAVSMEAIAEAASIGKSTLYARYANKAQLLEAVLEQQLERAASGKLPRRAGESEDPKSHLKHLARELLKAVGSPQIVELRRLLQQSGGLSDHLRAVLTATGYEPARDEIAICIAQTEAAKAGAPYNSRRTADALMAMLLGWDAVHRFNGRPLDMGAAMRFADYAVDILLAGRRAW